MIEEKDYEYFFKGVMFGIVAMPFGSIIAGIFYGISIDKLLINCIPLIVIAVIMLLGIVLFQKVMIKAFEIFGKIMNIVALVGVVAAGFKSLTGVTLIKGLAPLEEGAGVLIDIGIVLMGSYPIIHILKWALAKPLDALGRAFGLNASSMMGLVIAFANSVPVFGMIKDMNSKGKVINSAWVVCAAAALGAHLGFTAGVAPDMIGTLIIGKVSSGFIAVVLAAVLGKEKQVQD